MTAKEYLSLPYTWVTREMRSVDGSNYFLTKCIEIDNCFTVADTYADLRKHQQEVLELCINVLIDNGDEVPLPSQKELIHYH